MTLIDVHQHVIPDVYKKELASVGVLGSGENPWPAWSLPRWVDRILPNTSTLLPEGGRINLTLRRVTPPA